MHDWPGLSGMRSVGALIGLLILCYGVAALGAVATAEGVQTWYPTLNTPPWTPPNWAFGPIWTVLYGAMAVAAWDVWRRPGPRPVLPMALFAGQLGLNAAWSPVFFGMQQVALGMGVIVALWVGIVACIATYWPVSRWSAALMVPYLVWISIASSINVWVWLHP